MAEHKSAIKIDTRLNNKKIEGDFKELEAKTKRMINQYNKSIDSIKGQELALEKVKQKLDDINSGKKMLPETKELHSELEKINKELAKYELKAEEISNKQINLTNENVELKKQPKLLIDHDKIKQNEQEILNLDNEMQLLAKEEEQAKQKAKELSNKISELKTNSPEVQILNQKIELMSSKLAETKKQTGELGESIKENLNQKANLLGIQKGIDNVGTKLDKFKNRMTRLVGTVMVFSLLRRGLTSLRNKFSELLKTNDEYNSSLNQIKANLMTAFAPIYNACLPAINSLMSALSKLTGTIAVFISGLFGKSLKQSKKEAEALSKSLKKTADSGEDVSNSLSSIDEIQNVDDEKTSGGGGSSGDNGIDFSGELQYSQKLLDILNNIKKWVEDNQGLVIGAIGGITAALVLMKLLGLDPILSLGIGMIIGGIIALIIDFKSYLEDPSWENFGKLIRDIGIIILGVGAILLKVFGIAVAWPVMLAGVIAIIVGLVIQNWDTIKGVLLDAWNWIDEKLKWMEDNLGIFGKVLGSLLRQIVLDGVNIFKGLFTGFKQILDGIVMIIKGDFKNGIATAMKGIGNIIISVLNTIILGLNTFLTPFRAAITAIGSITGKKWSMQTIKIPSIPRLATGAVIPPNSEFAAILGDQKRGVNIETPLSTMLEAFNKALDSRDGGITTDLLLEIIQLLNNLANKETVMTVDGNRFAQLMTKYFDREQNRLNKSTAIEVR